MNSMAKRSSRQHFGFDSGEAQPRTPCSAGHKWQEMGSRKSPRVFSLSHASIVAKISISSTFESASVGAASGKSAVVRAQQPVMTDDEAIQIARDVAIENGWTWHGKVCASFRKPMRLSAWLFGTRPCWHVASNIGMRGCNVHVSIDDESGEVIYKAFGPR